MISSLMELTLSLPSLPVAVSSCNTWSAALGSLQMVVRSPPMPAPLAQLLIFPCGQEFQQQMSAGFNSASVRSMVTCAQRSVSSKCACGDSQHLSSHQLSAIEAISAGASVGSSQYLVRDHDCEELRLVAVAIHPQLLNQRVLLEYRLHLLHSNVLACSFASKLALLSVPSWYWCTVGSIAQQCRLLSWLLRLLAHGCPITGVSSEMLFSNLPDTWQSTPTL